MSNKAERWMLWTVAVIFNHSLGKKKWEKTKKKAKNKMNRKLSGHIQSIGVLKIGFKHFERILERFSHGSYVHLPPRSLSISPQTFSRNNHKTKHTTTTINRSPHFKQENPNSPPQNPRFLSLQGVGLVRVLLFYLFLKAKPRAKIRTEVVWEPQSSPRVRRRVSRRRQKQLKFKKIIIIKASMGISTDPPNSAPDALIHYIPLLSPTSLLPFR